MGKKKAVVGIVLVILVLLLCVCGGVGYFVYDKYIKKEIGESIVENIIEGAIESETGSDVDIDLDGDDDDESFHIESEDGSFDMSSDEEWPSEIPSDVPEFKYGNMIIQTSSDGDDGQGWVLSFEDVDSGAYEDYKADLEDKGWTVESTTTIEGLKMFTSTKGDNMVSLTLDTDENAATVSVMIEE